MGVSCAYLYSVAGPQVQESNGQPGMSQVDSDSTPSKTPRRPLPAPETPRKKRLRREVAKLRTKVHRLEKRIPHDNGTEGNEGASVDQDTAGNQGNVDNTGREDNMGSKKKKGKKGKKRKIDQLISQLEQYLPGETVEFVKTQLVISKRSKYGYRWASSDKMLALSIFYHSRKAYKLLQRVFCLPSKRTLQRSLAKSNIAPGFNDNVFSALKVKLTVSQIKINVVLWFLMKCH